jgi:hypothetical protein
MISVRLFDKEREGRKRCAAQHRFGLGLFVPSEGKAGGTCFTSAVDDKTGGEVGMTHLPGDLWRSESVVSVRGKSTELRKSNCAYSVTIFFVPSLVRVCLWCRR